MSPKSLVLLAIALGCGLVASIAISQVIDGNKNQASVETVAIYVALQNINLGDPVDDSMVSLEEWPKDKVPLGAITVWEDIVDRRPRSAIIQGEPLLDGKFLEKGQQHDPISSIPKNMRLATVLVDARKSAAGLLSPGDRVDVQIFVRANKKNGIPSAFTKIILQNIRVFAVDQAVQRSGDGSEGRSIAKTVSLVVTPAQSNKMTTAVNIGDISLIPRHPDDDKIVDDSEQGIDFLLGRSEANSREKEQGVRARESQVEEQQGFEQVAAVNTVPHFEMQIIFPNEVSVRQFSSETGKPIVSAEGGSYGAVGADGPSRGQGDTDAADSFSGGADLDADDSDADGDFPIDFTP